MNILGEMEVNSLRPTEVTYTSVMMACASRRDYYKDAFRILERMKGAGFMPNEVTYSTLLHACEVNGDFLRAEMVFKQLLAPTSPAKPNQNNYTSLINAYANAQIYDLQKAPENAQRAEELFKKMLLEGVTPDVKVLTALLKVYTEGRLVGPAEERFKTLFDQYGVKKGNYAYNYMIGMYVNTKEVDKALKLFDSMKAAELNPDRYTYNYMLYGCSEVTHSLKVK